MTIGEFQLYARGWAEANAPQSLPVTRGEADHFYRLKAEVDRMNALEAAAAMGQDS